MKAVEFAFNVNLINQDARKETREMEAMDIYYNMVQQSTRGYDDSDEGSLTLKSIEHRTPFLPLKELKKVALDTMYFDFVRDQSDEGFYLKLSLYKSTGIVYPRRRKIDESDEDEDDDFPIFRLNIFNTQDVFIVD